jgi:hypothetical protein
MCTCLEIAQHSNDVALVIEQRLRLLDFQFLVYLPTSTSRRGSLTVAWLMPAQTHTHEHI